MTTTFKQLLSLFFVTVMSACSTTPRLQQPDNLFNDHLFSAADKVTKVDEIFSVNEAMRQFIATKIYTELKSTSHQRALFNALYNRAQLKLEYEASFTRTASETFDARSGNCLSLVIMTAALAKEMQLAIQYQEIQVGESWSRNGELYFSSGHVNIVLGKKRFDGQSHLDKNYVMTIDFLPPEDTAGQRAREIEEHTVVAMFMNNRAAEALARNRIDEAYWWARSALQSDPQYAAAYNTLGVIYLRHRNFPEAYVAIEQAMQRNPQNTIPMSNMAQALHHLGRESEAIAMETALQEMQPYPPFHFFKLGIKAMEKEDYADAKRLFKSELKRAPDYHEFHFWLGLAHFRLGEINQAEREFEIAKKNSTTQNDFALYAAKLDHINAHKKN